VTGEPRPGTPADPADFPVTPRHDSLAAAIEAVCGAQAAIRSRHGVGGGCINTCSRLELSDGRLLFLKENSARFPGMFRSEAEGLVALEADHGPRVPKPLAWGETAEGQFLLMEWIEGGKKPKRWAEDFGRSLARLHSNPMPYWGFPGDNYIGGTPQPNVRTGSWSTFFGEHRLGHQVRLARKGGLLGARTAAKAERLIARLPGLLANAASHPSILHGDLWSGNVMAGPDGEAVMVDPAAYFGHGETDLAMTELFGRMDESFYRAYDEILPRPPGYAERREIYNLYHLLNHLNLFGGSYLAGVERVLDAFA
jgi:fructosamine-3-kinase